METNSKRLRFIEAVSQLTDADYRCIYQGIALKMKSRRTVLFTDPKEVFNVVMESVLTHFEQEETNPHNTGRILGRSWREDIDIRAFFINAAGSELSNQANKELNSRGERKEDALSNYVWDVDNHEEVLAQLSARNVPGGELSSGNVRSVEESLLREEIGRIAHEILENIFQRFQNDAKALHIINGLTNDLNKDQILHTSGMPEKDYLAARKRIRRAIDAAGDEWNLTARLQNRRSRISPPVH